MSVSAKILIANGDLCVGAEPVGRTLELRLKHLLGLLSQNEPDVLVLDLTCEPPPEKEARSRIGLLRSKARIPLIVVAEVEEHVFREFRFAGATECLRPPISIWQLNLVVQQLIALSREGGGQNSKGPIAIEDLLFDRKTNMLHGCSQRNVLLTTSEARLLSLLLHQPFTPMSRAAITDGLYSGHRPANDRAVDVLITRLRNKLVHAGGDACRGLIRTEFRSGYTLVAEPRQPSDLIERDVATGSRA